MTETKHFLYHCENPKTQGISNVLIETASPNAKIESQIIDFNDYTTIETIVEVLNNMENQGLHLVSSDGVRVFHSKKIAEFVENLHKSAINKNFLIENNLDVMLLNHEVRHLTRTCNLREAVFNLLKQYIVIKSQKEDY